jgi:lipoyl-dependent peroxiredoxin
MIISSVIRPADHSFYRPELGSGTFQGQYFFTSRFQDGTGTNPEELIGAAHAGCFSMALSGDLSKAGYTVEEIITEATVLMEKGQDAFAITSIKPDKKARVKDIVLVKLAEFASGAAKNCPVSKVFQT